MSALHSISYSTGREPVRALCWSSGARPGSARQLCCSTAPPGPWHCHVTEIAGVESELEMPFAALHQLCGPMLSQLPLLPAPQQQALQVAFGLATGDTPDRFVVGLAVLGLLADAAAKQPIVCLVDDAQWLDEASSQVLGVRRATSAGRGGPSPLRGAGGGRRAAASFACRR